MELTEESVSEIEKFNHLRNKSPHVYIIETTNYCI